jgi:hypothetical protein
MAGKRTPDPGGGSAAGGDLTAAIEKLNKTVQSLAAESARLRETVQPASDTGGTAAAETPSSAPANAAPPAEGPAATRVARLPNEEARRFYERLEQAGQLVEVGEHTDLSTLPPGVTHVRRPDGSVERIGFSASPYPGR